MSLTVGRDRELAILAQAYEDVLRGQPRIVTIQGEAGMGKSHLVDGFVSSLDPAVLLVQGQAFLADARPYGVIDGVVSSVLAHAWCRQLDAAGALVELRGREAPRFDPIVRQVLAVSLVALLLEAAARRTLVVVVEDLHYSDLSAIEVLSNLAVSARERARARDRCSALVLITHRPIEAPDATHRASMQMLSRPAPVAVPVDLSPLDELAINEMLRRALRGTVSKGLLETLRSATGGIPLLVEEAIRQIVRVGASRGSGDFASIEPGALSFADLTDVNAAIDARLAPLDDAHRATLQWAALVEEPFDAALLRAIVPPEDGDISAALDAGWSAAVVTRAPHRFAHPLVRERLLVGVSPNQREHMHARAARALAELPAFSDRSAQIAHHLRLAGTEADPQLVDVHGVRAIDDTFASGAYEASARYAELVLARLGADDRERAARYHHRAGVALYRSNAIPASVKHIEAARLIARATGDADLEGQCLVVLLKTHLGYREGPDSPAQAEAFLGESADCTPEVRAMLWCCLSEISTSTGQTAKGLDFAHQAVHAASLTSSVTANAMAVFARGLAAMAALDLDAAAADFRASADLARRGDRWIQAWGAGRLPMVLLMRGQLDASAEAAKHAYLVSTEIHDWAEASLAKALEAAVWLALGDLARCQVHGREALQIVARSEFFSAAVIAYPVLAMAQALSGSLADAHRTLSEWSNAPTQSRDRRRAFVDALAGAPADPRWALRFGDASTGAGIGRLWGAGHAAIIADRLNDRALAAQAIEPLAAGIARGVVLPMDGYPLLPRARATATRVSGATDQLARADEAIAAASSVGCEIEHAFALVERAHAHIGVGATDLAAADLEVAASIFQARGVPAGIEIAERLGARRARSAATQPRALPELCVVLMTDIVDSTTATQFYGDHRWADLQREHDSILRGCLVEHGGTFFAHRGDGLTAWFSSAHAALGCAHAIHAALARWSSTLSHPIAVRIGLCQGAAEHRGDDLSGLLLSKTTRVMSAGGAHETVATADVASVAAECGFAATDAGLHRLKGFAEPEHLYLIVKHN